MHTYRFHVTPTYPTFYSIYGQLPVLSKELVSKTFLGVILNELTPVPNGGYTVEMHSGHADRGEVMRVIEQGFGQLGFSLAQALITEWATSIVEGALIGGTGGGVIGSSSKQAGPTAAGAIIGLVVGGLVGAAMRRAVATYRADRQHPYRYSPTARYGWEITQLMPAAPVSDQGYLSAY